MWCVRHYAPGGLIRPRRDRAVNGVGHLGHDEAMEAGGRQFDPQTGEL